MTTTPNLPGPVPRATTAIGGERVKKLIKRIVLRKAEAMGNARFEEAEMWADLLAVLDSFDALPALRADVIRLQAENERLRELDSDPVKVLAILMDNGTLRAELAAARPLMEAVMGLAQEHSDQHQRREK